MTIFRRCRHERVRCIHGDEIVARRWRRIACRDCGRALKSWNGHVGALCSDGGACVRPEEPTGAK